MDIELAVAERLGLLALLPREGNLTTLRIVQQLRLDLSFSEGEHTLLGFQEDEDGMLRWNPEAECVKVVSFGATAMQVVQDKLSELNKAGKLRAEHLSLCDKFGIEE
jgi:hypothetical protein